MEFIQYKLTPITATVDEILSSAVSAAQTHDRFCKLQESLQLAKSGFDAIGREDFYKLMKYYDVFFQLKRAVNKQFNMPNVTNASLKMYEIICQMQLLVGNRLFRVFCNAELPGAFIVAINHYVKTRCPTSELFWTASSYYPLDANKKNVSALEDFYGIYERYRDRWLMGPPPNAMPVGAEPITGDVMDPVVVMKIADAVHKRGGADLYTSDAGLDVSGDYSKQEETTAMLNFGQILSGLVTLRKGGHLVTKQYTFFMQFNRSLIALLTTCFTEFYIIKPATSRPANSEIYLVGKNFKGIDPRIVTKLLDVLATKKFEPLIDEYLYVDLDEALFKIATEMTTTQIGHIDRALGFYAKYNGTDFRGVEAELKQLAQHSQAKWLRENPMKWNETINQI